MKYERNTHENSLDDRESPRKKVKAPGERLRVLSESSQRLNIQFQEKLQELAQGQRTSEFSKSDPYNFINTYAKKLGYLAARKKDSLKSTAAPIPAAEPPRSKIAEKNSSDFEAASKESFALNSMVTKEEKNDLPAAPEYENDFDGENSVPGSPALPALPDQAQTVQVNSTSSQHYIPALILNPVPKSEFCGSSDVRSIVQSIDWLIVWLIVWPTFDWLIDWLIDC